MRAGGWLFILVAFQSACAPQTSRAPSDAGTTLDAATRADGGGADVGATDAGEPPIDTAYALRVVALSEEVAPGLDTHFGAFSHASIDDDGRVAFAAGHDAPAI